MDKAKSAITDFMGKAGHHDTTVHETVAPAVQHEVIKPHEHEEVLTAVDKEVHQDHYHRTVQPVQDREVLPEQHEARLGAVQHREVDHRDIETTKRNLAAEQAQFKNQRVVEASTKTQTAAPTIGGEHVHHHIHETIQPVVQKEIIQPHVTHTTVPIHEVHHNAATHHNSTALPAMTMEEFKTKGGSLTGREERYDGFEGVPKNIGGTLGDMMHGKTSKHDSAQTGVLHKDNKHGDFDTVDGNNHHRVGGPVGGDVGTGAVGAGAAGVGAGGVGNKVHPKTGSNSSSDYESKSQNKTKPGLMAKLNPKVDADGDGKAGFMK